jgi:hypothetical protein
MSGWRVPGYVVEDFLGFGASSQVWRGRVSSTGEPVAFKRLAIGDGARVRAAQTEAAVLMTLDHPHLVRVHEVLPTSDAVVLVLDLADGGTLAELVAARGRITPGEVITALSPIAAALAYAHTAGVVHGDVTPSNVLFTAAGMPLLADLGVARLLDDDDVPTHSTPAFIDPAVAVGHIPGPQSDVFMLGAVTLHALTGRPLWPGETPSAALAAAAAANGDEIAAKLADLDVPDVPDGVRAVLTRALSVLPAQRGTAAEFALDLRHAGTPVAVELAAGRQRAGQSGNGGAAAEHDRNGAAPAEAPDGPPSDAFSTDAARPPFDRPRTPAADSAQSLLTHAARPRPRPTPNRGGARRARRAGVSALQARWVAAAVVIAGVALAVVTWVALGNQGTSRAAPAASSGPSVPASADAPPPPASSATATAASPSTKPTGALNPADIATVLARLDKQRERAFAHRDVALLKGVYLPGPLLDQDTKLLLRIVPEGCGLIGVHTSYDGIQVSPARTGGLTVSAQATLSDSLLSCGGKPTGRAPGSGPATLHIGLTRHGSAYLISAIDR